MARGRSNRTARKRAILLKAIAQGLTVSEAAASAGMSWRSVFDWKDADPQFATDYKRAYEAGTDVFIQEAKRRAFTGSDALLIFLLKQRDPLRFNQKMIEVRVGGDPNAPVTLEHRPADGAWIYPRDELARPEPTTLIEAVVEEEPEDRDPDEAEEGEEAA
jgi:hypothetical protein